MYVYYWRTYDKVVCRGGGGSIDRRRNTSRNGHAFLLRQERKKNQPGGVTTKRQVGVFIGNQWQHQGLPGGAAGAMDVNSHTLELYNMCYLVSHCLTLCACHGPQARIAMPGHYLRLSRADYQLIVHGNNDATLQVALLDCIRHAFCLDEKKHHVKESSEDKLLKLASCFAVEVFEPGKHTDRESSNVRRLQLASGKLQM
jgi:hypothetical protein